MNKKIYSLIFFIAAVLNIGVLLYHAIGIFYPPDSSPYWRHAIFVIVNGICLYGIVKRPIWFTWFVGILTIQQWYSHGSFALELWKKQHIIDWISIGVLIFMPVFFLLLLTDQKVKPKD